MKHYNEALKRNPDNHVLYSNRGFLFHKNIFKFILAACYTKLMEFQRAIDDCDTCIKRDPKFGKKILIFLGLFGAVLEETSDFFLIIF